MDFLALCSQVQNAVRQAAKHMEQVFTTQEKGSCANIVTSADLAVQAELEQTLCALLPGSALFGEESVGRTASAAYLWVVDPIDGTTNFARGIPECAISVALLVENEAVLGVVYNPARDRMFYAVRGMGAWCNASPIHVSARPFSNGLLCTAMSLYKKEYAPACVSIISEAYLQCNDIRRFGSCALELCYLACGECDLYFEFRVFPWDYAAAALILQEAGGIIRGLHGAALTHDRTTPLIAANTPSNYEHLSSIVSKHIPQVPYQEVLR